MPAPKTIDPLLEELNGALQEPNFVDRPPEQPVPFSEQMKVDTSSPPKPQPQSARLDKTHSLKAGGFGYRVTVEGEYYAAMPKGGKEIKRYSLPFNLPALTNEKGEAALGIIVGASRPGGGMLKAALLKLDPMSKGYHTHEIVKVEPLQGAPEPLDLQYMSFAALSNYAREHNLPLDPNVYWDARDLREDIIDLKTNEAPGGAHGAKKSPLERVRERHAMRVEEKQLREMNNA